MEHIEGWTLWTGALRFKGHLEDGDEGLGDIPGLPIGQGGVCPRHDDRAQKARVCVPHHIHCAAVQPELR